MIAESATGREAARADRYRADLQRAGLGDGHCGFVLRLPTMSGWATLRVFAGGEELDGSPVERPSPGRIPPRIRTSGRFRVSLDPPHLSGVRLTGWAVDLGDPGRPLRLALVCGGTRMASARACLFRPERAASEAAFCGFDLPSPAPPHGPLALVDELDGTVVATVA